MECACVHVDVWDGEGGKMLKEVERTARRAHMCVECGRVIHPGDRYQDERLLFEGKVSTLRTCPDCMSLRRAMFCECWIYGELWAAFSDYLTQLDEEDVPWSKIGELTPSARYKALARVEWHVFRRCEEDG